MLCQRTWVTGGVWDGGSMTLGASRAALAASRAVPEASKDTRNNTEIVWILANLEAHTDGMCKFWQTWNPECVNFGKLGSPNPWKCVNFGKLGSPNVSKCVNFGKLGIRNVWILANLEEASLFQIYIASLVTDRGWPSKAEKMSFRIVFDIINC